MALGNLRGGTIWTLFYTRWKKNFKIYAFILYGGIASNKIHALNLGAQELNSADRAKIIAIIRRLGYVPGMKYVKGPNLYRLFNTFARPEIRKCYRTYFRHSVTKAALINYGILREGDLTDEEKEIKLTAAQLHRQAMNDMIVKVISNNKRAHTVDKLKSTLATPSKTQTSQQSGPSTSGVVGGHSIGGHGGVGGHSGVGGLKKK